MKLSGPSFYGREPTGAPAGQPSWADSPAKKPDEPGCARMGLGDVIDLIWNNWSAGGLANMPPFSSQRVGALLVSLSEWAMASAECSERARR